MKGAVWVALIGILFCAALMVRGCQQWGVLMDKLEAKAQVQINACKESGGVPILSVWDDSLSNCIYPPKGSE